MISSGFFLNKNKADFFIKGIFKNENFCQLNSFDRLAAQNPDAMTKQNVPLERHGMMKGYFNL